MDKEDREIEKLENRIKELRTLKIAKQGLEVAVKDLCAQFDDRATDMAAGVLPVNHTFGSHCITAKVQYPAHRSTKQIRRVIVSTARMAQNTWFFGDGKPYLEYGRISEGITVLLHAFPAGEEHSEDVAAVVNCLAEHRLGCS